MRPLGNQIATSFPANTFTAMLCVAAASILPGPLLAQVGGGPAQSALAGSRVFGSKGCVGCHAIDGLGGTTGPDLAESAGKGSFYDMAAAMWNHLPGMAATMQAMDVEPPRLGPWDVENLIAFLFTLDYFDEPGNPDRGRELFTDKGCITCHQIRGTGGVIGPGLDRLAEGSPIALASAMWNHGTGMLRTLEATNVRRPTFSGAELDDLIAFVRGDARRTPDSDLYVVPGRADLGRTLFRDKSCVECHRVGGVGASRGIDLGARGRSWSLLDFAAAMWNKGPTMRSALAARTLEVPTLEPGEMADLLAYLYSVRFFDEAGRADRGRGLVGTAGCLTCHRLQGAGAGEGADLAERRGLTSPGAVVAALWNHVSVPAFAERGAGDVGFVPLEGQGVADLVAFFTTLQGRS